MKISFGRFVLIISLMALFSQSYSMETANLVVNNGHAKEEHNEDIRKKLNEACDALQQAALAFGRPLNPEKYHLIPYDPSHRFADENGFKHFCRYLTAYIYPPRLQEGDYPQEQHALQDSLAQEVRTSIDEEARISRETNGFKHVVRRLAGGAIFGAILGLPPVLGLARIAKFFVVAPPLRTVVIPYGIIFAITGMFVTEIMFRIANVSDCHDVINAHRENIKSHGLVLPAMAQQLKARPEFRNDQAAHRLIDQITDADE